MTIGQRNSYICSPWHIFFISFTSSTHWEVHGYISLYLSRSNLASSLRVATFFRLTFLMAFTQSSSESTTHCEPRGIFCSTSAKPQLLDTRMATPADRASSAAKPNPSVLDGINTRSTPMNNFFNSSQSSTYLLIIGLGLLGPLVNFAILQGLQQSSSCISCPLPLTYKMHPQQFEIL